MPTHDGETNRPTLHAEIKGNARLTKIDWCVTCDGAIEGGPATHLIENPDHYVISVDGALHIWRYYTGGITPNGRQSR